MIKIIQILLSNLDSRCLLESLAIPKEHSPFILILEIILFPKN